MKKIVMMFFMALILVSCDKDPGPSTPCLCIVDGHDFVPDETDPKGVCDSIGGTLDYNC